MFLSLSQLYRVCNLPRRFCIIVCGTLFKIKITNIKLETNTQYSLFNLEYIIFSIRASVEKKEKEKTKGQIKTKMAEYGQEISPAEKVCVFLCVFFFFFCLCADVNVLIFSSLHLKTKRVRLVGLSLSYLYS